MDGLYDPAHEQRYCRSCAKWQHLACCVEIPDDDARVTGDWKVDPTNASLVAKKAPMCVNVYVLLR